MGERALIMGDLLYVMRMGFVQAEPVPSTQPNYYKYRMQTTSPNSGGREVGIVLIPDYERWHIKIVTVMWIDEQATKAGTI